MGALIVIALVIIVGLVGFVQIAARRQTDVLSRLSQADAASIVVGSFGAFWKQVNGPGDFNFTPKLQVRKRPTLSVDVLEQPNGSVVQLFVSSYRTRGILMEDAQLMWRKKLATARKITAATQQTALQVAPPQAASSTNKLV